MKHDLISRRSKTSVTLPEDLVAEAKALNVNVSRACTRGLAEEVKKAREEKWIEEHRDHFAAWNRYVEENGLPLAEYRQF